MVSNFVYCFKAKKLSTVPEDEYCSSLIYVNSRRISVYEVVSIELTRMLTGVFIRARELGQSLAGRERTLTGSFHSDP